MYLSEYSVNIFAVSGREWECRSDPVLELVWEGRLLELRCPELREYGMAAM